jgi:hypothetical protein
VEALNAFHYFGVAKQVRRQAPGQHQRWEAAQAAEHRQWEEEQQERQQWDAHQQQQGQQQEVQCRVQQPAGRTQWVSPFLLDQQQGPQQGQTSSPLPSLQRSLGTPAQNTPSTRGCMEHQQQAAEGQGHAPGANGAWQQLHLLRLRSGAVPVPSSVSSPQPHTPEVSPVHTGCRLSVQ